MEGGITADKDYLSGLQLLRSKIKEIEIEIQECEKKCASYASEDGWTEAEYKFTTCLEVSAYSVCKQVT